MKLCIQCCVAYGDPEWEDYLKCVEKYSKRAARPDTEITVRGSSVTHPPGIVAYSYAQFLHKALDIENAIQAERDGFDAFTQDIMNDHPELSEVVQIPVIKPLESRLHVACLLGRKVSFLSMNERQRRRLDDTAILYGFRDRVLPGSWIPIKPPIDFKNPGPVIKAATAEIKNLGRQGVDVVICSGTPLGILLIENGVTDVDGVIILEPYGAVVKMAEMLVDLRKIGVNPSRKGQHAPMSKAELEEIRKVYGVK
jgi:allantoin racemase